jgi:hypothetical protein
MTTQQHEDLLFLGGVDRMKRGAAMKVEKAIGEQKMNHAE